ncbi:hypothetical protein DPEC_G00184000 [Dallia pectoralis]|uniref:Uncharacterized protein n=1 Tax=Dallia pectoralis TaxID=75939 RepID=A0ACC2GB66_DALPE|nr:hypothetical protein DPEC_G00184000 [Dallia pectoralis]
MDGSASLDIEALKGPGEHRTASSAGRPLKNAALTPHHEPNEAAAEGRTARALKRGAPQMESDRRVGVIERAGEDEGFSRLFLHSLGREAPDDARADRERVPFNDD